MVKLNRGNLQRYTKRLAKDEGLRIPGNADQGQGNKKSWNIIMFCKPTEEK